MKNKEIEEILNELKNVAERHTIEIREYGVVEAIPSSINKELRLNSYSANLLLSYIEQLEKDNYNLDKENQMLFEDNLNLKKQKDDVVEYIKKLKTFDYFRDNKNLVELLRMLGEIDVED